MKALLVIDVQNGLVNLGNFEEEIATIEKVIQEFNQRKDPVIFIKHIDDIEESPLLRGTAGTEIYPSLAQYAELVIEKQTPSSFFNTELDQVLKEEGVSHLYITGFNSEFCCLFTAIAAYDRGYKVTVIEDATGTVNQGDSYEYPSLDIRDFIGTVMHWSGVIEVVDYEEYVEQSIH